MDEQDAIKKVKEGDKEAFEVIMRMHVRALRAYLSFKAPVPDLVDEIAHRSFIFAYLHIDEFESGRPFFPWLRAIAGNLLRGEAQRYCRQQANRLKYTDQCLLSEERMALTADKDYMMAHLNSCTSKLSKEHRELVNLKYMMEETSEQVAKKLGRTVVWVNTTIFRVRDILKKCIEHESLAKGAV